MSEAFGAGDGFEVVNLTRGVRQLEASPAAWQLNSEHLQPDQINANVPSGWLLPLTGKA